MPFLRIVLPRLAILVDPSSPGRAARSLVDTINIANTHPWDIVIFPEGGRFTDGKVHDFLPVLHFWQKKPKDRSYRLKLSALTMSIRPTLGLLFPNRFG